MLLVYIKHVTQVRPQSTTLKYQGKQEVRRGIALNSPDFLLSLEEKLLEAKPRDKFYIKNFLPHHRYIPRTAEIDPANSLNCP